MQSPLVLAAVICSAAALVSADTFTFINKCSHAIDLVHAHPGNLGGSVIANIPVGGNHVKEISGPAHHFRHGMDDRATLAEIAIDGPDANPDFMGTWYDISIIPPGPEWCPSYEECKQTSKGKIGFNVPMSMVPKENNDATCTTLTCLADDKIKCADAYHFPKDDLKTHKCKVGTPFDIIFCPEGGGASPPAETPPTTTPPTLPPPPTTTPPTPPPTPTPTTPTPPPTPTATTPTPPPTPTPTTTSPTLTTPMPTPTTLTSATITPTATPPSTPNRRPRRWVWTRTQTGKWKRMRVWTPTTTPTSTPTISPPTPTPTTTAPTPPTPTPTTPTTPTQPTPTPTTPTPTTQPPPTPSATTPAPTPTSTVGNTSSFGQLDGTIDPGTVRPSNVTSETTTVSASAWKINDMFKYTGKHAGNIPGEYMRVTQLKGCVKEPFKMHNPVGPMSEEVSVIFRGPMEIHNIAVYQPGTGASPASEWKRVSSYTQTTGETENMVILNNKNIDFSTDGPNRGPQGFATEDGAGTAPQPTKFKGLLAEASNPSERYGGPSITTGAEINIMTSAPCIPDGAKTSECLGFHGKNDYHGWDGGKKIFVTKVKMPQGATPNQPAIWMLPAQVMHSGQYGCNCRGMGPNGGCGELDIAEVIETNDKRDAVSAHYYFFREMDDKLELPGDNWGKRPFDKPVVYVTIIDDSGEGLIKILELEDFDFTLGVIPPNIYSQWLAAEVS